MMEEIVDSASNDASGLSFPWRYVVPRRNYRRLLKVARLCPEIRPNVDREAKLKLASAVLVVPYLATWVVMLPFFLFATALLVLTQIISVFPDFHKQRAANADDANRKLSLTEIARRMGEC